MEVTQMNSNKKGFSFKEQGRILRYLFSFTGEYKRYFIVSIIMMMIAAAIAAYLPIIIQQYIDNNLTTNSATLSAALTVAFSYMGLELIRSGLNYSQKYLFSLGSEMTVAKMRNRLYSKLGHMNLNYFHQTPNGEVVSRVTNDTETIKEFWNVFLTFFDGLTNAVMIAVAMFSLSARISWVFMAFVPVIIILVLTYQRISTVVYKRMRSALANVNARLSESITGMRIINHFNQKERMQEEFKDIDQEYVDARVRMFKMNALLLNPAVNLIQQLVLATIIVLFGYLLLNDFALELGLVYAFTSYAQSFFSPISHMMDSLSQYQDALVSGNRGMNLLADNRLEPVQSPEADDALIEGQVTINDLSFSYDGKTPVLQGIDIQADPGQMIAFVGHTGSGKSTITNLLMRFYEFEEGEILYDHKNIRDYNEDSIRDQVGLVQQESFIFHGNFYDNIRMHGDYTDEEVQEAARFSGAHEFITATPRGYHTLIQEGGSSLSEGQKQLISIARAVLRNPSIMIFDEATANIDSQTESHIQNSLQKFRGNHTLIVIAHRLSTIKNADIIYVLGKGRIIEQGDHDSLIEKEGTYFDMYRLQSLQGVTSPSA